MRRGTLFGLGIALAAAVYSPAGAYNLYVANLHSHCILSDGIGTVDEAFAHARDVADIDVLALTDHTHLLTTTEFNYLLSKATEYTQNGVFVALGCQEFGNLNEFGHINIFDAAFRNPNTSDNLTGTYAFILSQGAFGSFNHPNQSYGTFFNNLQFYPEYANAMKAIELLNGKASESYEAEFLLALSRGWRVGPLANQDNHQGNWGDQGNPTLGNAIYLTGIWADALTKDAIYAALRARRFYAMEIDPPNDRIELTFQMDGHDMGEEITTGVYPHITAHARSLNGTTLLNRFDLFRDGSIIHSKIVLGTDISYDYYDPISDGEEHYYFIRAHQVDNDYAWSAPIWVTAELDPAAAPADLAPTPLGIELVSTLPNPSTGRSDVTFRLPDRGAEPYDVRVSLLDASGRLLRDLGTRRCSGGQHHWAVEAREKTEGDLPSGVYVVRIEATGLPTVSGRLVLLR